MASGADRSNRSATASRGQLRPADASSSDGPIDAGGRPTGFELFAIIERIASVELLRAAGERNGGVSQAQAQAPSPVPLSSENWITS